MMSGSPPADLQPQDYGISDHWIPQPSIQNFVTTFRACSETAGSRFRWPSDRLSMQKTLEIAMTMLVPGTMLVIQNGDPIPEYFSKDICGCDVDVVYHGTYPECIPSIALNGLRGGAGAGSADVGEHYIQDIEYNGERYPVHVPGVYASSDFYTAAGYPMEASAAKANSNAGSLLARDGTPPMRAIVRCLAAKCDRLWKSKNQAMYYPHKLHMTHIMFYGVEPHEVSLRHVCPVRTFNVPMKTDLGRQFFGSMQTISEPTLETLFLEYNSRATVQVTLSMPEGFGSLDANIAQSSVWHKKETYETKGLITETLSSSKERYAVHHVAAVGQFKSTESKRNWIHTYGRTDAESRPASHDLEPDRWLNLCINEVTLTNPRGRHGADHLPSTSASLVKSESMQGHT